MQVTVTDVGSHREGGGSQGDSSEKGGQLSLGGGVADRAACLHSAHASRADHKPGTKVVVFCHTDSVLEAHRYKCSAH